MELLHYRSRRQACRAVGFLVMVLVSALAAWGQASPTPPALGLDLSGIQWFASADLPHDSTPATIRSLATPTSPTVVLRSATGSQTGMLFCIVSLDSNASRSGGRITIGDIDGEDETFFNGEKIGETRGWGVTDMGVPRMYSVPPSAMREGENVLAVRVAAFRNKSTFGIKREPLTLSFVTSPEKRAGTPAAVSPISPEAAKRAIFEVDSELSSTEQLHHKRPGFGRFGEFFFDGLPAVAEVSPTRIASRKGPVFELALDHTKSVSLANEDDAPAISSWQKRMRVRASVAQTEVQYGVHSNVMYPGAVITLEQGKVLPLRVRFPGAAGVILKTTSAEMKSAGIQEINGELPEVYVLCDTAAAAPPALLLLSGLTANVTQSNNQMELTLAAKSSRSAGRAYAIYPTGIRPVTFTRKPENVLEAVQASDPNTDSASTLRKWLSIAANEPDASDEFFRVLPDDENVRIYQVTRYNTPGEVDLPPLVFRPAQLDFAHRTLKYPVGGQLTTSSALLTFSGEWCSFVQDPLTTHPSRSDPDEERATQLSVNWYDLPVPPMKERGLLAAPGQKPMRELLDKWILSDVGSTSSVTSVDALYKSRTQAFQAFSYLTSATQAKLIKDSTELLPVALGDHFWQQHTEPLSGLSYYWTYFIEGPYFQRFDQDWGNGLSLVGLYTFIKYAGQWELARKHWDQVERIFSWFTVTDDWEWMRASNGQHGHGTGAGDCESATLAACIAYARLAQGCGRNDEYHYGLYMAARAAVFAIARFGYDDFSREAGLSDAKNLVLGFHEGQGFLLGELDRYPWNITSAISGNGIQPGNFDLYLKYAADHLRKYEQTFETAYPRWSDPNARYPFPTLYRGNSGYITLPHIYLRARLGMESTEVLHDLLLNASQNSYLWWLAPPVIAEVMHSKNESAYVSEWGRCAFLGGEMIRETEGDKRRVRCIINFDNREAPDWVEIVLPKKPLHFQINDGPVPLTDSQLEETTLRLRLRRPGLNTINLQF